MVIPGIQEEQEVFGPEQAPEKDQFILEPKKEEPEYVFEPLNDTQINSIISLPDQKEEVGDIFSAVRFVDKSYNTIVNNLSKNYNDDGFVFEYDPGFSQNENQFIVRANNGAAIGVGKNEQSIKSMLNWMSENSLNADEREIYSERKKSIDNSIQDFFKNDIRFKDGQVQTYANFLPDYKGGSGTKKDQKDRSVGDFNYDDQLKRLKKELNVDGTNLEYYFDDEFEKIGKRYHDNYLEDFNRKQRIKRESVREEDDAINIKNDYKKINYTDNEIKLSEINKQIDSLKNEMSQPSYGLRTGTIIDDDKSSQIEKLQQQRNNLLNVIGNSKGWHGSFLTGLNFNKENALKPAFTLDGDFVDGLAVDEDEDTINNDDLMTSANKFSSLVPDELKDKSSIKDYLTDKTDEIAFNIAASNKIGDDFITLKGLRSDSRGYKKIIEDLEYTDFKEEYKPEDPTETSIVTLKVRLSDLAKHRNTIFNPSERNIIEDAKYYLSFLNPAAYGKEDEVLSTDDMSEAQLYTYVSQYANFRKQNMSDFKVLMALTDLQLDPRSYNKKFGSETIDAIKAGGNYIANTWSIEAAEKAGMNLKSDFNNKLQLQFDTYDWAKGNEGIINKNAIGTLQKSMLYEYGYQMPLEFTEDLAKFALVGKGIGSVQRAFNIGGKNYTLFKTVRGTGPNNRVRVSAAEIKKFKETNNLTSLSGPLALKAANKAGYTVELNKYTNLYKYGFGIIGEEFKMKTVFEEDYKVGGGTAFYAFGGAFGRFGTGLTKGLGTGSRRLNTVIGVPYSGLAFATSSEAAKLLEGGWKTLNGGETFAKQLENAYPNYQGDREFIGNMIFGSMLRIKSITGEVIKNPYANSLTSTAQLDNIIHNGHASLRRIENDYRDLETLLPENIAFKDRKKELELEHQRTTELISDAKQQLILSEGDVYDTQDPNKIAKHITKTYKGYFESLSKEYKNVELVVQQGNKGFAEKGLNPLDPAGIVFKNGGVVIGVNTLTAKRGMIEHEIGHELLKRKLKNDKTLVGKLVNGIEDAFKGKIFTEGDKQYTSFREYIKDLYTEDGKAPTKKLTDIEFITNAIEFMADPIYYRNVLRQNNNGSLTTWSILKDKYSTLTGASPELFADKKSIIMAFARTVQELKKGNITSESMRFFENLANRKGKFASKEFDWLDKGTQFNDIKLRETQETNEAFRSKEKEVDALVGEKVNGKYTVTKAEWDNPIRPGSAKAFDALYTPKESNIFRGIILKGIEGNNVYGRSKDAFVERVTSELARDIMNFNPEKNNSLSGYLANRVIWAKGDILNEFAKKPFEKSRDVEAGELGSVRERGAEDVGIKTFEDNYVFGENKKNIDKSKKETGLVQTEKGLIEPLEIITPKPTKDVKVDEANKKQIENIENKIEADKPADLSGKNIANLEPSKELVDLVKPLFGKNRKDQIQNMIDNGELYYKAYFPESAMYGEGVIQPGKSSTMISKAFPMFYVPKGERAIKATEIETGKAGTKSGLEIRDRMPWSQAKTVWENMSWSDLKIADLKSNDLAYRNQGTALNSFYKQAAKVINNRGVRKLLDNEKLIQQLADGKGEYMAAKLKDGLNDIRSPFGKTYESSLQAINLYQRNPSDFRKRFPNEWKIINNLSNNLGFGLKNVENATGFVEAVKQFKLNSTTAKKFGITNEEFQAVIGEVSFLQRRYDGKDYNLINVEAATTYSKNVTELQAYLSNKFGETFSRSLLGDHYRTNMGGITNAKAKQKYGEYADGSIVKFDKAPEFSKVYDKSKQVDKGGFFNNISEVTFKQINSLKNSYDKANKLVEQGKIKEANEVLDKAFSVLDNNARKEIYNSWQKSKEAWLNSSTSKQQWLERAKHILLMGRNNTNVEAGERQLAEVVAVYRGDVVGITKLEHAKPMVKQSVDAALAVINGEWSTKGEQIMKDFKGIIGPKSLFNIIDLVGKTTNPSGMARMVFDFESLKDYQVVGTEKSLYDVLSERSLAIVGKDLRKEGLLHLKDQLIQLSLRGEQADIIIAENAIKNSDKYKRLHNKNANILENMGFSSKGKTNMEIIEKLSNIDKAIRIAKDPNKVKKGISIFDFDDTVGRTKSKVIYEMPDGTKGKINAAEFATRSTELEAKGAKFDFSEFDKVVDGTPGPFINKLRKAVNKFGNENVFILTARPQQAAIPIQKFLQSLGVNLKIENITGLADGRPEAKAQFIVDKAAKGYNDFYFVDDAYKNVQAVQKVLNVIDVKSDVQQAFSAKNKNLNNDINSIIEYATGIGKEKTYSKAKAEITGKGKKNWSLYMPNRAGDFYSLTNALLGKGKKGLENREWFKENLSKPFSRGDLAYQTERRIKMADYFALKKQLKDAEYEAGLLNVFKKNPLKKPFEKDSKWTNEHAVRVYNWNKQNTLPTDISKSDVKKLVNHVNNNPKLKAFAEELIKINKQDGYPAPKEFWVSEGITQDMLTSGENVSRKRHMKQFIDNANIIFSPENLNKMEAALGPTWRRAMEDAIERMKTGTNRPSWGRGNKWESDILDFMNGSISGIMFLNVRSAILQQVSIPNYINVTDNNPFKAAKAFSNFPQFAKDYVKLMNDSWSRNRRDGLRYNIQESEIVEALSRSKNKGAAIIDWALKKGFVLTKYADSHATAFGGASFYRNRLNTYKKKGLSEKEAEQRALEDWREMSDGTQQTSRMDRVSQEQKSVAGRLILPFSSVQLAYGRRYIDDPARDLINGRYEGLIKGENSALKKVGQIVYGTVIQGAVFHALQQGVFKVLFEDGNTLDGEELEVANATLDGILVGMGIRGKAYATFKNWLIKAGKELQKDNPKLRDTASDLLKVSPPIDKKYRQIRGALATLDYDMDEMSEISLDNPGLAAAAGIIEASTNAPVDRLLRKMQNVKAALEEDRANWQRPFLLGGWAEYDFEEDDRSTNTFRGFTPRKFEKKKFKRRKIN
tara:strand:+ start:2470 stop:11268 length:8799 start_codon:yes stop_codon:yes gene_type:complete